VVGGDDKGGQRHEVFAKVADQKHASQLTASRPLALPVGKSREGACGVRTVSSTPLVVTHPCALVRDALHGILSKSQFRPLHILPAADVVAENYPGEGGFSV
jgi:hypothetical protein